MQSGGTEGMGMEEMDGMEGIERMEPGKMEGMEEMEPEGMEGMELEGMEGTEGTEPEGLEAAGRAEQLSREGDDDEEGAVDPLVLHEVRDERDGLDGFPQPHLVGQDPVEVVVVQRHQPLQPFDLGGEKGAFLHPAPHPAAPPPPGARPSPGTA